MTDAATVCKHIVLKADMGRVKFSLMVHLENRVKWYIIYSAFSCKQQNA